MPQNITIKKKLFLKQQGFTIVELMVTLTIVVLVTGIVMLQYSSFNSAILLTSQAYLTAFDVRETQTLAISVRGQGSQFREEYGLYFDMSDTGEYLLFQDDNSKGKDNPVRYNPGEEIGTPYKLDLRYELKNICVTDSGTRTCYKDEATDAISDVQLSNLAISFKRPDFDANFYSPGKSSISSAEIIIGIMGTTHTKEIVVSSTGQISVK